MIEVELKFDPFRVLMPPVEVFVGEVNVILPDVTVKLLSMDMGLGIPGAPCIAGTGPLVSLKMDIPEPGVPANKMMAFFNASQELWQAMHQKAQEEFDKKGALLDGR